MLIRLPKLKLLGHASIKTTQIYAKVIENKVSEDMGTLKARHNKSTTGKLSLINLNILRNSLTFNSNLSFNKTSPKYTALMTWNLKQP
jgi:hypothetical protein